MDYWIYVLLIGAVAGWLAGTLFKGAGFGLIGNIIIGIIGGFVGYWLLGKLGISMGTGVLPAIFTSVIGAGILLFIASLIKK